MRKRTVLLTLGGLCLLAALALTARNLRQEARAQTAAEQTLQTLAPIVQTAADAQTPLEAEAVPDGVDYIGVLEIPALKLTLPVAGDWSYALLDLAPCRYAGSAYLDDLVILGHNYRGFFRDLSQLQPGDAVFFTDTDGNRFSYAVSDFEQLRPSQTEDMLADDWDLTLFTCTPGAQNRLAVRCLRSDP